MDRSTDLATSSKRDLGQVIEWQVWSAVVAALLDPATMALGATVFVLDVTAAFDEHAWVIPAADIPRLVSTQRSSIELMLHPAGGYGSKYDRFRIVRSQLADHSTQWFTGRHRERS